jgi:hypothetical protein
MRGDSRILKTWDSLEKKMDTKYRVLLEVIREYLYQYGIVNAIDCARYGAIRKYNPINIDWHEYAAMLDLLNNTNWLTVQSVDSRGQTIYRLFTA